VASLPVHDGAGYSSRHPAGTIFVRTLAL